MKIEILRLSYEEKQTLGIGFIFEGVDKIYEFRTLELAWKNNENDLSCIPAGSYPIMKYNSPTKGEVLLLDDVADRNYIEIHKGNFHFEINGCILPGRSHSDINRDGLLDVISSKDTLDMILKLMPDESTISIYGKY